MTDTARRLEIAERLAEDLIVGVMLPHDVARCESALDEYAAERDAEIVRLREAMAPFSGAADAMDDSAPKSADPEELALWVRTGRQEASITLADCRRARAALRGEPDPTKEREP